MLSVITQRSIENVLFAEDSKCIYFLIWFITRCRTIFGDASVLCILKQYFFFNIDRCNISDWGYNRC